MRAQIYSASGSPRSACRARAAILLGTNLWRAEHIRSYARRVVRKVIESTLVSLDGVIGDPQVWPEPYFDDEAGARALKQLLAADAMLMGRRTYEIFSAMWPASRGPYAERVNSIRKYVFSSSLETAEWSNSTIISGEVATAVRELKQEDGHDLVMYGHGPLAQALLEHHLLDELRVWVHPAATEASSKRLGRAMSSMRVIRTPTSDCRRHLR
jgi:dihydrofolate reductase